MFVLQVVDDIVQCVRNASKEVNAVSSIKVFFIVGGFAESDLLKETLEASFPDVNILRPMDPALAIVKGAVMFGLNPTVVSERVMTRTYGVGIAKRYNPDEHGDKESLRRLGKISTSDGLEYCNRIFSTLVRKGDSVSIDHCVVKSLPTFFANPEKMYTNIYSSIHTDIKFTDDPGCHHLGTVCLPRRLRQRRYPTATFQIKFGGTEIKASIRDHESGDFIEQSISYFKSPT